MLADLAAQKNVQAWLEGPYDETTKQLLQEQLKANPRAVSDAFYTHLTFGTGGLRGLMGLGTNRINPYTIRAATQGVADVLKEKGPLALICVGYDSRLNSRLFAEETAKVFAGNGFKVYFFKDLRPSPLVSFGVRRLNCAAGIMITASHNPPEYNGYKVYGSDGAQIQPPLDKEILAAIQTITSPADVKSVATLDHPLIEQIDLDPIYLQAIRPLQLRSNPSSLKIVYTSLHGTGITLVPAALAQAGFKHVTLVEEQVIPDGTFPSCKSPNPEDPAALDLGIKKLEEMDGDLLIATDPDADRMGAAVRHKSETVVLTGNQIASLCLYTLLNQHKLQGKSVKGSACIKTIPTTELFRKICDDFAIPCADVLIGFKNIASQIALWEQEENPPHFLFAGEESFGYLLGDLTRDKDGVTAAVLIAEAAAICKEREQTLIDLLHFLYQHYGYFSELLLTIDFPETQAGRSQIVEKMATLRKEGIGIPLKGLEDYSRSLKIDYAHHTNAPLNAPKADLLVFYLQDDTKIVIRPSGTEPKIKVYCNFHDTVSQEHLNKKAALIIAHLSDYLKT